MLCTYNLSGIYRTVPRLKRVFCFFATGFIILLCTSEITYNRNLRLSLLIILSGHTRGVVGNRGADIILYIIIIHSLFYSVCKRPRKCQLVIITVKRFSELNRTWSKSVLLLYGPMLLIKPAPNHQVSFHILHYNMTENADPYQK